MTVDRENTVPSCFSTSLGDMLRRSKLIVEPILQDLNVPDTCKLTLATSSGSNCKAFLFCDDHSLQGQDEIGHVVNDGWNVCYKDGEQQMHDDAIGDFSVTFTAAGGVDGNTEDG